MTKRRRCTCNDRNPANAIRTTGQTVALWTCPQHGNVSEDRASAITLTPTDEAVLAALSREHKEGRSPTADEISRITNYTIARVERAMALLLSIGLVGENIAVRSRSHDT